MADSSPTGGDTRDWYRMTEQMNEGVLDALEETFEAQAEFAESMIESAEEAAAAGPMGDLVQGYARAYRAWIDASRLTFERMREATEGEPIELEEFRDIWLDASNEALKDLMGTEFFAAATGRTVDELLDWRQRADEAAELAFHNLGLPTESDVVEVGERLVELERRQHDVERKLDRILDEVEG